VHTGQLSNICDNNLGTGKGIEGGGGGGGGGGGVRISEICIYGLLALSPSRPLPPHPSPPPRVLPAPRGFSVFLSVARRARGSGYGREFRD